MKNTKESASESQNGNLNPITILPVPDFLRSGFVGNKQVQESVCESLGSRKRQATLKFLSVRPLVRGTEMSSTGP